MRNPRSVLTVAAAVAGTAVLSVLGTLLPAPAVAADRQASGYTEDTFTMYGDNGDYITGGNSFAYSSKTSTFTVTGTMRRWRISVGRYEWDINVQAANGDFLETGTTYTDAHRFPFNDANAGFDASGQGRGCNTSTTAFTVREATYADDSTVTGLVLDFEQHCDNRVPAAHGTIVWHAAHEEPPADPEPGQSASAVSSAMVGRLSTHDGYQLFRRGTPAQVRSNVEPAPTSGAVAVRVQVLVGGVWRSQERLAGLPLDGGQHVSTLLEGRTPVGRKFRVRTEWKGDARTEAGVSAWRYFRFVR